MTTSAEVRYKEVQAQRFLKVAEDEKLSSKSSYTDLIIAAAHGYLRVSKLAEGVSVHKAELIRVRASLEEELFSSIIGYSKVHYKRLQKDTKTLLREAASNRLYRFAQILEHAIELYDGDEETALRWLKTPNPAFGNEAPIEMLKSEVGADMVDRLITQLELGILPI
jgi:putative toxin-antitoxin system antitoxin component (TIGR02293 family)